MPTYWHLQKQINKMYSVNYIQTKCSEYNLFQQLQCQLLHKCLLILKITIFLSLVTISTQVSFSLCMRTWKKSFIFFCAKASCETLLKRDSSDKNKDTLDKDYLNVSGSVSILVYTDIYNKRKNTSSNKDLEGYK